jgi:nucleoside-diphosphate-sugar epimerase
MVSSKTLITGADGFIGSHLTKVLVRACWARRARFRALQRLQFLGLARSVCRGYKEQI